MKSNKRKLTKLSDLVQKPSCLKKYRILDIGVESGNHSTSESNTLLRCTTIAYRPGMLDIFKSHTRA